MLTRKRPEFRTVDRWATTLLLEAGAIHKCDQHGWAKDPEWRRQNAGMITTLPLTS